MSITFQSFAFIVIFHVIQITVIFLRLNVRNYCIPYPELSSMFYIDNYFELEINYIKTGISILKVNTTVANEKVIMYCYNFSS